MSTDLIVSVSGIRGILGQGLGPTAALRFAQALGTFLEGKRVLLSRDSRPSGRMLRHAVIAGLTSAGCEVLDIGIMPTPTVGIAVVHLQAAGAIQITASHNPAEWNGLKLFGSDGAVLNPDQGKIVKDVYDAGNFRSSRWDAIGECLEEKRAESWHRERVEKHLDIGPIRSRKFRVLLDANGGAGGSLGRSLLEALGAETIVLGGGMDGKFAHPPEPTAENLTSVLPEVSTCKADVGFVLDPDSDRLAILDETGRYIGEELTLALGVAARLRQEQGPVAINMSTSRVVEDIAQKHGVVCHRSAVGEANVVARMREVGALIGGEGNGGVIDPRIGWVRDPFIGMGLVLQMMAETGKRLSELVAELPSYAIVKDKYTIAPQLLPTLYEALVKRWPEARTNRIDGLRLDWERSWLHVRASNTEPIVRVIAEAPDAAEARKLCADVGALIMK